MPEVGTWQVSSGFMGCTDNVCRWWSVFFNTFWSSNQEQWFKRAAGDCCCHTCCLSWCQHGGEDMITKVHVWSYVYCIYWILPIYYNFQKDTVLAFDFNDWIAMTRDVISSSLLYYNLTRNRPMTKPQRFFLFQPSLQTLPFILSITDIFSVHHFNPNQQSPPNHHTY